MIVNGQSLLKAKPIKDMIGTKEKNHGVSWGLSEVGYDIRIKQDIHFSPRLGFSWAKEVVGTPERKGWYTDSNFILASAMEEFQMPNYLCGIVHDKSTWARKGLSVFNTVIESGWKGFLTLELVYHGNEDLVIPAGSGIAQVIFHQISQYASYKGKYQNQADEPVDSVFT